MTSSKKNIFKASVMLNKGETSNVGEKCVVFNQGKQNSNVTFMIEGVCLMSRMVFLI